MSDTAKLDNDDLTRFRFMKEGAAARAPERGTDDMPGFLEVWRDGMPILAIFCSNVDRDEILDAVWYVVPAVEADRVIAVMDAHLTKQMENPTTGKPWGPGEMQKACHEDMLCSTGLITDCLLVHDIRRDGTYYMQTLTYHVDEVAKAKGDVPVAVHWQETGDEFNASSEDDGSNLQGVIPDALREAFERKFEDTVTSPGIIADLPESARHAAQDAAAIVNLSKRGYGVGVIAQDQESEWFLTLQVLLGEFSKIDDSLRVMERGDLAEPDTN